MSFESLRAQLAAVADRVYLNTGTSGPMPESSLEAEIDLLRLITREGFASPPALAAYSQAISQARESVASVLKCDPASVALTHSTSEGIGIVAAGISWQAGDEVIISDLEHVSGVAPWRRLAIDKGVVVRNLKSRSGYLEPEQVVAAITPRTKLICISHVSYATGAILPVREVCVQARQAGAMVVVDGAQGAGHLPVDVSSLGCDFYALPGQKWLLGPEGTGALYVAPWALEKLTPTRIGWASVPIEGGKGEKMDEDALHSDARRFETGTIHAPAFAALTESIRLLQAFGWEAVFERARSLAGSATVGLAGVPGVKVLTPESAASGLLTFEVAGIDPDQLVRRLWSNHRIVIRSIPYPPALRASFHAFNDESDVEALVSAVAGEKLKVK